MQDDWLIVAKHASTGYLRTESIANLTYRGEHSRFDLTGSAVGQGLQSRVAMGCGAEQWSNAVLLALKA